MSEPGDPAQNAEPALADPSTIDPPRVPVWPVYAATVLMVLLPIVAIALLTFAISLAVALYAVSTGSAPFSDLEMLRDRAFTALFLSKTDPLPSVLTGVFANCVCFGGAAWYLAGKDRARLRIHPARPADLLIGSAGLLGLTVALDSIISLLELDDFGNLAEMRAAFQNLGLAGRLLASIVIAFGAGLGEELYFRGFLLTRLELAHGRAAAVVISSIIFGAFHFDAVHTPISALMGAYLAATLLYTGSLWVPIAAHIANNFCAVLLSDATAGDTFTAASIPAGLLICALALARLRRRHRHD